MKDFCRCFPNGAQRPEVSIISALINAPPLVLILALAAPWAMGWHLTWQLGRFDMDDPERCMMLFRSNRDAGLIPALIFAIALLL